MSDDIMSCMETTTKASKPDLTDFGALRHSTMVSLQKSQPNSANSKG